MRILPLLLVTALSCSGCDRTAPPVSAPANAVEPAPAVTPALAPPRKLRALPLPGPVTSIEIVDPLRNARLNRDGSGFFYFPGGEWEEFTVTPEMFRQLESSLTPFRQEADTYGGEANKPELVVTGCKRGTPFKEQAGHVTIGWIGEGIYDEFFNDFGCGSERNADRNTALFKVLATLPRPKRKLPSPRRP